MTYGVDQCRRCGVPIKMSRPGQMKEYLDSLKLKPTMPEKEWRAMGLLAMPTRQQLHLVQEGCCPACAEIMVRRKNKPGKRFAKVAIPCLIAFAIMWVVAAYITH